MAPYVYTIAPNRPFLATLARGLVGLAGGDPLRLPRMTVLLPTRRAARALREMFLRLTAEGGDPGAPFLGAEGALDPAERRNRLLRRQAEQWRQNPPRDPVIAAGLVGGIPALSDLLSAVAWVDHGAVILPGLDRSCDAAEWELITQEPSHPQHLIATLLRDLEIAPGEVCDWPSPAAESPVTGRGRRLHLMAQALRPAALTDAWRELPQEPDAALAGLSRYDCASPQDEAATIAVLLRRTLETPDATAALVTPDRELARRVAAELRRWCIDIDDSAGLPLNRTPPGAFRRPVLDLADIA